MSKKYLEKGDEYESINANGEKETRKVIDKKNENGKLHIITVKVEWNNSKTTDRIIIITISGLGLRTRKAVIRAACPLFLCIILFGKYLSEVLIWITKVLFIA